MQGDTHTRHDQYKRASATSCPTAEAAKYTASADGRLVLGTSAPAPRPTRPSPREFYDIVDLDEWIAAEKAASFRRGHVRWIPHIGHDRDALNDLGLVESEHYADGLQTSK